MENIEDKIKIAIAISNLRFSERMCFELPQDESILAQFYKLAIYCFTNFPIPESHQNYIDKHLEVDFIQKGGKPYFFSRKNATQIVSTTEMTSQLISKWQNTKENFSLELELRAVEVLFTWGHFVVTPQQFDLVMSLINSLGRSIQNSSMSKAV
jgi:hypothetical protein